MANEQAMRAVTRGILATTDASTQASTAAQQFVQAATQAQQARLTFHLWFVSYMGGNISTDQFLARVDHVIEAHDTVADRAADVHDYKGEATLPLLLSLTGPEQRVVPKGNAFTTDYTLTNIGTRAVEGITGSTTVDVFEVSPTALDTLAADESTRLTLSGTATEAGKIPIQIRVTADLITESQQLALTVLDKEGYLEQALADLDELQSKVTALKSSESALDQATIEGLSNKLQTAETQLKQIQRVSGGPSSVKAVNNQLGRVIELLEAFNNQVHGLMPSQLPVVRGAMFIHDAEEVNDQLEGAISAAL